MPSYRRNEVLRSEYMAQRLLRAAQYAGREDEPDIIALIQAVLAGGDEEAARMLCEALESEGAGQLVRDDPLFPYPKPEWLRADGIPLGEVEGIGTMYWGFDEMPYSAMLIGSPGWGKTNLAYIIIWNLIGPEEE